MHTTFELKQALDAQGLSDNKLIIRCKEIGVQTNALTIGRIKNGEIKRLPLDLVFAIDTVLQLSIDDWIKVVDSPVPLQAAEEWTDVSSTAYRSKLEYHLKSRGWSQSDLVERLDKEYGLPGRMVTINRMFQGTLSRLPVEMIAPISVILGVTPGQWIDVSMKQTDSHAIASEVSISSLLDEHKLSLEEMQRALLDVEATTIKMKDTLIQKSKRVCPPSIQQVIQSLEIASAECAEISRYLQQYALGFTDMIPSDLFSRIQDILQTEE